MAIVDHVIAKNIHFLGIYSSIIPMASSRTKKGATRSQNGCLSTQKAPPPLPESSDPVSEPEETNDRIDPSHQPDVESDGLSGSSSPTGVGYGEKLRCY